MSDESDARDAEDTRLEALWEVITAIPPEDRARYAESLDVDPALREELASLIAHAADAERFFGRLGAAMEVVVEAAALEDAGTTTSGTTATDVAAGGVDDPVIGHTVGHYRIEGRLGAGGMGVVYRAHDTRLDRPVALKFLATRLNADPIAQARFLSEARAAAALDHVNICTIHEVGGGEEIPSFIAMAFYSGETLEQVLGRGPLPPRLAVDYAAQIARALSAAHDRGIIHGDVKPSNVIITGENVVKLLDFGIARLPGARAGSDATPGTVAYMSPEQVRGERTDHRSDLWSLGVVLYEACTGLRPFRGDVAASLQAILGESPVSPSELRLEVPATVAAVVERLLEKDPAARYASAGNVVADLAAAVQEETPLARAPDVRVAHRGRLRRRVLAPGLVGIAVLAAFMLSNLGTAAPLRILIADAVGDTIAGATIADRMRQMLAAPGVTVMGRPSVEAALSRMGRAPTVRVTPATAREVAMREGIPGYVHLTVDRIGKGYAIGAALVETESGDLLDHHQTVAMSAAELPAAADRLANGLRRALGRSYPGLHQQDPMLAVTTDSVSALRRHVEAVQANRNGDFLRGIELEDETIAIDPEFADAHQTRAFALEQIGLRAGRAQNSILRAAGLRDGLTRHERYLVDADSFWHIEGDLKRAITSLRNSHNAVQELEPGRVLNRRSFGLALMLRGDLAEAESVLEVGRRFATCPATNTHLVSLLHALGKDAEARSVLDDALAQWPTNPLLGMDRAHFLARAGRYREAHEVAHALVRDYTRPYGLRAEAVFDAVEGRIAEGIDHLQELRDHYLEAGLLAPAFEVAAAAGRLRLVEGDTTKALKDVESFLDRHPLQLLPAAERPYLSLALFFADARAPRRARSLTAEYDTLVPSQYKGPDAWMQLRVRSAVWLAEDRPAEALRDFRAAAGADRIWSNWLDNLLFAVDARPELARIYDRLGERDSAIASYERYLDARVLYRAEMDAFHLAHTLSRLAVLYAQRNEPARAEGYTLRLEAIWRAADPKLLSNLRPQRLRS
jgi:tetratricopeptide (TPR) repeat protein